MWFSLQRKVTSSGCTEIELPCWSWREANSVKLLTMAQVSSKAQYRRSSPIQEDVPPFPRPRKNSNASMVSEGSPASLRRQRQNMHSFEGSSSNLSLPLLYIKERLQWTVFSAEYRERRYLNFLKSYRYFSFLLTFIHIVFVPWTKLSFKIIVVIYISICFSLFSWYSLMPVFHSSCHK